MTENKKFQAKIIYCVIIILVLPLLYWLGWPSVPYKTDEGETQYQGGQLATMLSQEGLTTSEIGKIDPTSSTLQLATFGMRGIAIAVLWHQQLDYEKKKDWNNVIATSNQIMTLEPHFTPVWEFLGWKLAYNASADVDDYRERYGWVIRGFEFLTKGTEYNKNSPILFDKAGWTISQKIGIADENVEYRQLFREDDAFHEAYHTESIAERDNWLFGIPWYINAEKLFEKGYSIGNKMRLLFYASSRMNLIHYAEWYEKDGNFGEKAKEIWHNAEVSWRNFADLHVVTTIPDRKDKSKMRESSLGLAAKNAERKKEIEQEITAMLEKPLKEMYIDRWNGLNELEQASMIEILTSKFVHDPEVRVVREYLDETFPNWKEELRVKCDDIVTDPEEKRVRSIPNILRTEEETELAQKSEREIGQAASASLGKLRIPLEEQVLSVSQEDFGKAEDLKQEYDLLEYDERLSNMFCEVLNYYHHAKQCQMEQAQEAVDAREYRHKGRERYFESDGIHDAYHGYYMSMVKWKELIEKYKEDYDYVADPQFRSQFLELVDKFKVICDKPEYDGFYPEDLPLNFVVVYECEEQMNTDKIREAIDFAQKAFQDGKYADARRYAETLATAWFYNMENTSYLKAVPVLQYRDDIIEITGLYVRSLEKTGESFDPKYRLTEFVNHNIKRDPLVVEALTRTAEIYTMDASGDDAGEKLDTAVQAWKPVLDKYPILLVPGEQLADENFLTSINLVNYQEEMRRLAKVYKQWMDNHENSIPEDFVLSRFLQ